MQRLGIPGIAGSGNAGQVVQQINKNIVNIRKYVMVDIFWRCFIFK